MRDLLSLEDLSKREIELILKTTDKLKNKKRPLLKGKILALLFEKASTRTRVSFDVAVHHLGGDAIFLSKDDIQLGRGETISDTAKVLSRYVDGIVARVFDHQALIDLAKHSSVPVINGLSDLLHPLQSIADVYTIQKKKRRLKGINLVFLGDGANNTCHSLIHASEKLGINMTISCHPNYRPKVDNPFPVVEDPRKAAKEADVLYVDTFFSMGQEAEKQKRSVDLMKYQLNSELVKLAKKDVIVMHPLPAHRGQEITSDVMDSKHSVIFDQAENRLHTEKAVLYLLMK